MTFPLLLIASSGSTGAVAESVNNFAPSRYIPGGGGRPAAQAHPAAPSSGSASGFAPSRYVPGARVAAKQVPARVAVFFEKGGLPVAKIVDKVKQLRL